MRKMMRRKMRNSSRPRRVERGEGGEEIEVLSKKRRAIGRRRSRIWKRGGEGGVE